jgi:hypothetical protein
LIANRPQIGSTAAPERLRHFLAHRERSLRVGPNGETAVGLHLRRGDARLQILRMNHLGFVNFFDHDIRFGHGFFGIADFDDGMAANIFEPRVGGNGFRQRHVLMQDRRVGLGRCFRIDDHGQRLVDDFDFFQCLLGDGQRLRGDCRYRVAHEADFVARENMAVDVAAAVAHIRRIGGGDDGVHAGNFLGLAGVDAEDLRVGVLAAQDRAVQLIFEHQVDAVDALADHPLDAAHASWARTDDFEFRFRHDDGLLIRLSKFLAPRTPRAQSKIRFLVVKSWRPLRALREAFSPQTMTGVC